MFVGHVIVSRFCRVYAKGIPTPKTVRKMFTRLRPIQYRLMVGKFCAQVQKDQRDKKGVSQHSYAKITEFMLVPFILFLFVWLRSLLGNPGWKF